MLEQIFFNQKQLHHLIELEKTDNSLTVSLKEYPESYIIFYELEPGAIVAFNHIRHQSFPTIFLSREDYHHNQLIVDICLDGICERTVGQDSFLSISTNRVVFYSHHPLRELHFPDAHYEGISFYINPDLINTKPGSFIERAAIDFYEFSEKFRINQSPYYNYVTPCIISFANYLWQKQKTNQIGQIRLLSANLFHEFMALSPKGDTNLLLTPSQMKPIKYCKQLLCEDLSKRITLKELSALTNVSESTLKSHFKIVYGYTITDYMNNKRMTLAEELLCNTNLSISDIAAKCGYENHSRFSAAFKNSTRLLL